MESIVIKNLREALEKRQDNELERFWNSLYKSGGPIIEEIDNEREHSLVTYVYKGNEDTENVVVVQPIGDRNPVDNMMERLLDTDLWYKNYKIRNDVRFRYYFSINDDLTENWGEKVKNGICDEFNDKKLVFGDGHAVSYVVMNKAESQRVFNKIDDEISGSLNMYDFFSESLNEKRRIWIYTPNNYDSSGNELGVGIFTDGIEQINILKVKDILDNMIYEKGIKPIIGVFIESTDNRAKELRCNEKFEKFVVSELLPWLKENYNVSEDSKDNVICGFSLGGLTALYLALRHSHIFGNVISQSGAYHAGLEIIEKEVSNCKDTLNSYINVGVLEDEKIMINNSIKVANLLKEKNHEVYFDIFKGGHDYLCWGEGLFKGLKSVMKKGY